jgi:hypothetical protein
MDASVVAKTPRKLAHPCRLSERRRMKYKERLKIRIAWRTDATTTAMAVRKDCAS